MKDLRAGWRSGSAGRAADDRSTHARARAARLLGLVGFAAVLVGAQLGRQRGVPAWDTIWAEDGSVFLTDALNRPFIETLASPYNGYMLLVPRLLVAVVAALPVSAAAASITVASAAVVALCSIFVYVASADVVKSRALRVVLAALPPLLPVTGDEAVATFANVHWFLMFAAFWAFVWAKRTSIQVATSLVAVAAAVLTDPLAGLLAPVAIAYVVIRRSFGDAACLGTLAVGLVAQRFAAGNDLGSTAWHAEDFPRIFGLRVADSLLVGDRLLPFFERHLHAAFDYAGLGIVILLTGVALEVASAGVRRFAAMCLGVSLLFFCTPLIARGTGTFWPPSIGVLNSSRYFILPILFLATAFIVVLDEHAAALRSGRGVVLATALAVWAAAVTTVSYRVTNGRSAGPSWHAAVSDARSRCSAGSDEVRIVVSPGRPWKAHVPCSRMR